MSVCSMMLSLVNGQMKMTDKVTVDATSAKTNITIGGDERLKIEYYTKKRVVKDSEPAEILYELHGNCYVWGVDVKKWKKNDKLQCQMAFSYDEPSDSKADWFVINLDFQGTDKTNTWSCIDGNSAKGADKWAVDASSNCMSNAEKSISSFNGDLGYFRGHWMRMFKTMDETYDIMMKLDSEKPGLKGNF